MKRLLLVCAISLAVLAERAGAEEIVCKGSVTSIQGEGLIARTHRFEIEGVGGSDLNAVIDRCRKIARERQNRAAGRNPGASFKPLSALDLQCVQDGRQIAVRRTIRTAP